ncbi:Gfo/Idh/MocA family protein [Undibacterium sp. TJN25]|uniref:Gfo/Idh/MocA family protein n=1 Tax=Undibacterium sp. TJN25 TaxID=3413056 RepID=UPI003BF3B4CA
MKNGKIGVGIIGVHPTQGWATTAHLPALQASPDFEVVALTNSTLASAEEAARKFKVPHFFQRHEDLLNCADVDLVVVTVKVPYHFELVSAAIKAGKSVYCEWPLGNGLQEALELQRLAEQHKVSATVGLQSRATPEMNFVRDMVRQDYVGEVLSATLVGSGIIGGAMIPAGFAYTLDPKNGAGILNVAFSHAADALCFALDTRFADVAATLESRRKTAQVIETGEILAMQTPDQIAVNGTLENGTVVSAHVRGGMSRGTNFRLEINGTRGDLVVTSSLGYPGIGATTVHGGRDDDALIHELEIPAEYKLVGSELGMGTNVANNYALLAADLKNGTHTAPSFADAVTLHRLIDAIEQSAAKGRKIMIDAS